MRTRILAVGLMITGMILFLLPFTALAHDPHECPEGIPDDPSFAAHMNQADILNRTVSFDEILKHGETLFTANFNICDGRGRPGSTGTGAPRDPEGQPAFQRISAPDSSSCAACHSIPRVGGGGDIVASVFVLAQGFDPVVDSISPEFSNSRISLGMNGSGAIEMLAREMTVDLQKMREAAMVDAVHFNLTLTVDMISKGVYFGKLTVMPNGTIITDQLEGVDRNLIVKPFHQAGVVVSLRQFTINAMNQHHGMQADERFDLNPASERDADQDGVPHELTIGDITAATLWQASLGIPGRVLPTDPDALAEVERGEMLFDSVGCATCHVPELHLNSRLFTEPNPNNPTGNLSDQTYTYSYDMTTQGEGPFLEATDDGGAIVRAYTDLKRHNLCDLETDPDPIRFFCNEWLAQDRDFQGGRPGAEFFLTRKLWDVGSQTSFGHAGTLSTISEAILMHGGEAHAVRDAFVALSVDDQRAIVHFLKTLQIVPPGTDSVIYED